MRFTYQPEALRQEYETAEFEELVNRARACLLWHMSPEYYDSMTLVEYRAWVTAWEQIQKEDSRN